MRTTVEIITELKDCSTKIRDRYREYADQYEALARENREAAQHQQSVIDDCEASLKLLRN